MTTELVNIDAAEIVMAEIRGTFARLTVRFTSEQSNLLRDAQDNVIEGDPGTTEKIVDLWTFERDTRSSDPNWALVETRSPEA
jgi:predicted lipid-binding transport protein (Tim44 family)